MSIFRLFPKSISAIKPLFRRLYFTEISQNVAPNQTFILTFSCKIKSSKFELYPGNTSINGDAFSMSGWKSRKNDVSFLSRDHRVVMFRSSLIHWQSLGESSAFVRAIFFSSENRIFFRREFRRKKTCVSIFWASYSLARYRIGILTWKNMRPRKILSKSVNRVIFSCKNQKTFLRGPPVGIRERDIYPWYIPDIPPIYL